MKATKKDVVLDFVIQHLTKYKIIKITKIHPGCLSIKTNLGWYRLKWEKMEPGCLDK